jgi:hypothetical protein
LFSFAATSAVALSASGCADSSASMRTVTGDHSQFSEKLFLFFEAFLDGCLPR